MTGWDKFFLLGALAAVAPDRVCTWGVILLSVCLEVTLPLVVVLCSGISFP